LVILALPLLSILCGESCLLVSWYGGGKYGIAGSKEGHGRSRSPGAEDREWSNTGLVLDGQMIKRSDDAVCGLHHPLGDEERLP
jgi:hypothetical protein